MNGNSAGAFVVVVVAVDDSWIIFFRSFVQSVVSLFVVNTGRTTGFPQQQ